MTTSIQSSSRKRGCRRARCSTLAKVCSIRRVRLGVTGLSRAGKTVFITALVHDLLHGGRLPGVRGACRAGASRARVSRRSPTTRVPRFDYERHLQALIGERRWPNSTVASASCASSSTTSRREWRATRTLTLDIVDYPGEWLLDLPLLSTELRAMVGARALALSRAAPRAHARRSTGTRISRRSMPRRAARTSRPRCESARAVHRLSARLPRRALRHATAAARPLPDAGRPRGLAGADLRAARPCRRRRRARAARCAR